MDKKLLGIGAVLLVVLLSFVLWFTGVLNPVIRSVEQGDKPMCETSKHYDSMDDCYCPVHERLPMGYPKASWHTTGFGETTFMCYYIG